MAIGFRAWLLRRDPGLPAVRRAGRVAVVACAGFYVCYYLLDQPVMATYALFAAVAMGVLSQIPGSGAHRRLVLLRSLPVALGLVTIGTLLAGDVWAAFTGVFIFGFVIAYSGVGSPTLAGLGTGLQLFIILACFPPYAPDTLPARLIGVCVGMGLLVVAERFLWPDRDAVSYRTLLAQACQDLAGCLTAGGSAKPPDWPEEGLWPSAMPLAARPTSAARREQALRDAGSVLSFVVARLRRMPSGTRTSGLPAAAAGTAEEAAVALRGGPAPRTEGLAAALKAARDSRGDRSLSVAMMGVWIMATAVRVAVGAPIDAAHRRRFPYAYASTVSLWARRYRMHFTPSSVFFQAAVRIAVALAAARLVAGTLDLSHGFWVLLATLTLLRSRAADTRSTLRPALVGTVAGAIAVGTLLVVVGSRPDVYAAITPPIMVVAFAAGAVIGPVWGQALFTVLVTLVFTQLTPAGAEIAGVRVVDVFVGAATGIATGLFTWPRGAAGELRRSASRFLVTSGQAVREAAEVLTAQPAVQPTMMPRVAEAMTLADAAYTLHQSELRRPAEPAVDWPAVITTGHHMVRWSQLLLDIYPQVRSRLGAHGYRSRPRRWMRPAVAWPRRCTRNAHRKSHRRPWTPHPTPATSTPLKPGSWRSPTTWPGSPSADHNDAMGEDWIEILDRLDRHGASSQLSPDTATLLELMGTYRLPGLSIAVGDLNGGTDGRIWAAGYGTSGDAAATPVNAHTSFQACSISKHVAAFGAMRMVAGGTLALDSDIGEYLTSWELPVVGGWRARVTLRQLLAHTAGLSDNWFRGYDSQEPVPSMLETLRGDPSANTPPVRPSLLPGSRFRYSGSHYAVLQQLMVDVTGSPFDELMRELVLEPVGMADSSFSQQFPYGRPQLTAHSFHPGATPVPGGWRTIPEMAGAGLWSTPTDLVRFELELARATSGKSELLDQDLATQMVTPQLPDSPYGLGTVIKDSAGHRRFGHTGGSIGYVCFSFFWLDAGTAVAVMANSDDAMEILASILAAAERRYATAVKVAPQGDVAGRYLLRDDYPIDIATAGGKLTLTAGGQPPAVLLPLAGGGYRHPGLDLEVTFQRTGEQPYTMELRQEGTTQTATQSATMKPDA